MAIQQLAPYSNNTTNWISPLPFEFSTQKNYFLNSCRASIFFSWTRNEFSRKTKMFFLFFYWKKKEKELIVLPFKKKIIQFIVLYVRISPYSQDLSLSLSGKIVCTFCFFMLSMWSYECFYWSTHVFWQISFVNHFISAEFVPRQTKSKTAKNNTLMKIKWLWSQICHKITTGVG